MNVCSPGKLRCALTHVGTRGHQPKTGAGNKSFTVVSLSSLFYYTLHGEFLCLTINGLVRVWHSQFICTALALGAYCA